MRWETVTPESRQSAPVVFLVDDEDNNLVLFRRSLRTYGYDLRCFKNGAEVLTAIESGEVIPDIIVSDVMMPLVNGYQLCETVKKDPRTSMVPVVLVTGLNDVRDKVKGLDAGADDFLPKPFHPLELCARVKSLLRIKRYSDRLAATNRLLADEKLLLENRVRERTVELEELTIGLTAALERANKMNDEDTGNHIKRVSHFSVLVGTKLGLDSEMCLKIGRFASLHDVGKVGIPDSILKKPGKLTAEEWAEMKRHTLYGYELLRLAGADRVAQNIALCHHEWFDGTGYPYGLKGQVIPIEARIVALADVYDALTSKRCYKDAFALDQAQSMITESRGKHFDPEVVDIFFDHLDEVHAIRDRFQDAPETFDDERVTMERPPRHLQERLADYGQTLG